MLKNLRRIGLGAMACAGLSGCGNLLAIHENDSFGKSAHIVTMDAKQRAIVSNEAPIKDGDDRRNSAYRRFCSEPAPDALTALSTGVSGDLGLNALKSSDPDIKLRAALAMSETASTIERTQTINVLREAMFRTCERYLNGSIDADELEIQAARDQRMIVSVLAIEQLTRTIRPVPTVLVSGAANAVYNDPEALAQKLIDAKTSAAAAKTAKDRDDKAFADYDTTNKCTDRLNNAKPTDPNDANLPIWNTCKQLSDSKIASDTASDKADAAAKVYQDIADKQSSGIIATSGTGSAIPGAQEKAADDAAVAAVSKNVEQIVEQTFSFDEFEMTCVVKLRDLAPITITQNEKGVETTLTARSRAMALTALGMLSQNNTQMQKVAPSKADERADQLSADLDEACLEYMKRKHLTGAQAQLDAYQADEAVLVIQEQVLRDYLGTDVASNWGNLKTALGADAQAWPSVADPNSAAAFFRTQTAPIRAKAYDFMRNGAKPST